MFWDIELLLLNPSNKHNHKSLEGIKNRFNSQFSVNNNQIHNESTCKLNEVLDFLTLVKNVDVYKAFLSLDKIFGKAIFILEDPKHADFNSASAIYEYLTDSISKFLTDSTEYNVNFDLVVVLGACVLFLNIFVRINWLGPPFSLSLESERVLSEKYQNKAVKDELDNVEILNESLVHLINGLDLNSTRSSFILDKIHSEFSDRCILKSPELTLIDSKLSDKSTSLLKSIIAEFCVDGESIYYGVSGIQYLYASIVLMGLLDRFVEERKCAIPSMEIWRSRLAYVWQLIVEDAAITPCPTLFNCTIVNYINLLKQSQVLEFDFSIHKCDQDLLNIIKIDFLKEHTHSSNTCKIISNFSTHNLKLDNELKSFLLIELMQRIPLYNLNRLYKPIYDKVSQFLDFSFDFTGKLGVRRKHQKQSIPQLIVDYKKANGPTNDGNNSVDTPVNITLDEIYGDTDIYETPRLDSSETMNTLSEMEQLFLLSKGYNILSSTPQNDQLALEFINAIATTCLREETIEQRNWLISSTGLWLRCKTEYNRTKTIERATLQLHSISDSFYEHNPPNRIEYFFGLAFPNTWNIKREIAKHMFSIGSFRTAFDIYKQLHLWEDAIQCLIISDRRNEARELVNQRLKVLPTAQLHCYLGDIENDVEHYKTAWKISGEKSSRAVRSLGARCFNDGKFEEAIEYLEKSLVLNPMNERAQFLLGCCYLRTSNFKSALNPFSRVVSLNPESSDCWGNIASCHMNLNNLQSAKLALTQAIKYNNTRWQFWKMMLMISVMNGDVNNACNASNSLIDLGKKSEVDAVVVAFLVDSSDGASDKLSSIIEHTLRNITANVTENADIWSLYAKYLSFKKDYLGALEATFKQYRKVEQTILATLCEKKDTDELQTEFDVINIKKLTNALSSMVTLLKRMTRTQRSEHRASVVETLKATKQRVRSRTPQVNEQFSREVELLIESAEVEDVIAVYE